MKVVVRSASVFRTFQYSHENAEKNVEGRAKLVVISATLFWTFHLRMLEKMSVGVGIFGVSSLQEFLGEENAVTVCINMYIYCLCIPYHSSI